MIGAAAIRSSLILHSIEPFDRLKPDELLLIASHMRLCHFEPDTLLLAAGAPGDMLYVTTAGDAWAGQVLAGPLFDAASVLFALPARCDYRTGASGLEALCMAKSHLFTIARECPDFVVGLASLGARDSA